MCRAFTLGPQRQTFGPQRDISSLGRRPELRSAAAAVRRAIQKDVAPHRPAVAADMGWRHVLVPVWEKEPICAGVSETSRSSRVRPEEARQSHQAR